MNNDETRSSFPGGLSDSPPYCLSARGLAEAWLEHGRQSEGTFSDGSHWSAISTIDLDYLMSDLVRISTGNANDYLMIFTRFGRHPITGYNFDCEWIEKGGDSGLDLLSLVLKRHVTWTVGLVEDFDASHA